MGSQRGQSPNLAVVYARQKALGKSVNFELVILKRNWKARRKTFWRRRRSPAGANSFDKESSTDRQALCSKFSMSSVDLEDDSSIYEEIHVHQVYEQIASHFSSTRYKPWPVVERFLNDLPDGSIGLDVGCGNGKYLAINPKVFIVASDRSTNLAKIASQRRPHSSIVANNLNLPHPSGSFDFAISIAVIHHLSTSARRIEAVAAVLDTLRPPTTISGVDDVNRMSRGRALVYVWALEQKHSRRGWDTGDEQDVMVPWVMKQKTNDVTAEGSKTFNRYYHLYRGGELENDIAQAGGLVLESGYEKDNWWAIAAPKPG